MSDEIYNMNLHDEVEINGYIEVLRVPGGWLYGVNNGETGPVFVPDKGAPDTTVKE